MVGSGGAGVRPRSDPTRAVRARAGVRAAGRLPICWRRTRRCGRARVRAALGCSEEGQAAKSWGALPGPPASPPIDRRIARPTPGSAAAHTPARPAPRPPLYTARASAGCRCAGGPTPGPALNAPAPCKPLVQPAAAPRPRGGRRCSCTAPSTTPPPPACCRAPCRAAAWRPAFACSTHWQTASASTRASPTSASTCSAPRAGACSGRPARLKVGRGGHGSAGGWERRPAVQPRSQCLPGTCRPCPNPCPACPGVAVDALEACAGVPAGRQPLAGPPSIPPRCHTQVLNFEACLAAHQVPPPAGERGAG